MIIRPSLFADRLLTALSSVHADAPILVGFVDTSLPDEIGLYSIVDDDSIDSYFELGKWVQLTGTRPGVPRAPDRMRPDPAGHDRVHPNALKRLETAVSDAWCTPYKEGSLTAGQLADGLRRADAGQAKRAKKTATKAAGQLRLTEVLCAILDESFAVGGGEIIQTATRIRFTVDGLAVEHEQPGLARWLKDKTFGVGRW